MENFSELNLADPIMKAIEELGFAKPTAIQAKAIPILLEKNRDIVGLAQTGTGKTAAFGLPLIQSVDLTSRHTQALVLAPTRELCLQVTNELILFAKYTRGLNIQAVYGGADISRQMKELRRGVQIVVATPGRLRDLIRRNAIDIGGIDFIVLDEADEMLNMGFKEELDDILQHTSNDKLTWLFSATMPNEVRRISREYMDNPVEITIGQKNTVNEDIKHSYALVNRSEKYNALRRFLDYTPNTFGLIFCRTRNDTKELADRLSSDGYDADALHGDLSQGQRDHVMKKFRRRRLQVLVATDVAARGIDVQEITHVFHFNIPDDRAFYTHRSGRTGRAGNKGESIIFGIPKDRDRVFRLGRDLKLNFEKAHIPTGSEICEQRVLTHTAQLNDVEVSESLAPLMPKILKQFEDLSKEEIIQRFASLSYNKFLKDYGNAIDLNESRARQSFNGNVKRLFINIGERDVKDKKELIAGICEYGNVPKTSIGRVNMRESFSFFEVEKEHAESVIENFKGLALNGREIRVNFEDDKSGRSKRSRRGGYGGRDNRDRDNRRDRGGYGGRDNRDGRGRRPRRK